MAELGKIVVVGGAGFIGTNLCRSALERGITVVVFDNFSRRGAEHNVAHLRAHAGGSLEIVRGDVRTRGEVEALVERHGDADALFHLAGQVAVTRSIEDPRGDFESNLLGTFNLLEALRRRHFRGAVVVASTNKVYGGLGHLAVEEEATRYRLRDHPDGLPESFPLEFLSPYGCSKGAADQYALDYARIYGLRTIVLRQSCIYGPHQFGIEDQGWVAWFTIAGMFGLPITVYGDGKQVRDILFVDDLIAAYWAAVGNLERTAGRAYNLGGARFQVSLLELLDHLRRLLGKPIAVAFAPPRPGDQKVFVCDCRKAQADFAWTPTTPPAAGLARLVAWIAENREIFAKPGRVE